MSARRLAIIQPEDFKLSASAKKKISAWVKKYPKDRQRSALIPALWIAQKDAGGWIPEAALREIGDILGMAYIRVYEVVTFYTMFNMAPVGEHHIQLCGTTPCWLRGSDDLIAVLERRIGPRGSVSDDGKLSWVEVECLGACANAPMAQISNAKNDHYYEDLTAENFENLLDNLVAGRKVEPGPQNTRYTSEPEGGNTTLTGTGPYHKTKLINLPNTDKKTKLNYYMPDPKDSRATRGGWVDPDRKASADPTKRGSNLGRDLTKGLVDDDPNKGRPKRAPAKNNKLKTSAQPSFKPKVIYTDGPTDGTPDDLKKINGIGPKFESDLNRKGIYYFRQIGAWKAADIRMVEALIGSSPGRIKRDEWVKQAKKLAKVKA
ncbi:MAG: NADH-quinone oxidoreductase subunit NuoE [Hellea sp.]|nr:NADH-quinone oxidoreductase subunit NuoE [Hellea sp.]